MEVGGGESGSKPEDDGEDGRQVDSFLAKVSFSFHGKPIIVFLIKVHL